MDLFQQEGEKAMTGEHAKIQSGKFPIYHQFTAFTALTNQTVLRYMTRHIITRITNYFDKHIMLCMYNTEATITTGYSIELDVYVCNVY